MFFVVFFSAGTEVTGNDRPCPESAGLLPGGWYHVTLAPRLIHDPTSESAFVCLRELHSVCLQTDTTQRCERNQRQLPSNPPSVVPMATDVELGVELGVGLSTALVPLVFFLHSKATWSLHSLWQFIPQSEITHEECRNV